MSDARIFSAEHSEFLKKHGGGDGSGKLDYDQLFKLWEVISWCTDLVKTTTGKHTTESRRIDSLGHFTFCECKFCEERRVFWGERKRNGLPVIRVCDCHFSDEEWLTEYRDDASGRE